MTNSNSNPATATVTNVTAYTEQRQPDRHGTSISPTDATIISASIAAVIIVVGWVVNICQILRRDREARAYADRNAREDRLRNYEGFLVEKEQITEASSTESIHQIYFAQDG